MFDFTGLADQTQGDIRSVLANARDPKITEISPNQEVTAGEKLRLECSVSNSKGISGSETVQHV